MSLDRRGKQGKWTEDSAEERAAGITSFLLRELHNKLSLSMCHVSGLVSLWTAPFFIPGTK